MVCKICMHKSMLRHTGPPESAVFSRCSPRDDLRDEDPGIITDVRVICTACYTKPQPWVTLRRHTQEYVTCIGPLLVICLSEKSLNNRTTTNWTEREKRNVIFVRGALCYPWLISVYSLAGQSPLSSTNSQNKTCRNRGLEPHLTSLRHK